MIKCRCDWCARTMTGTQPIGQYMLYAKNTILIPILAVNARHICKDCMEKAGILTEKPK